MTDSGDQLDLSKANSRTADVTFVGNLRRRFGHGGIGRQISWLLSQSAVEAMTMTVAALLTARWFGPVALGQLTILLAGVQLVTHVGDGFFPTILKYVSEAKAQDSSTGEWIGWRFSCIALLILIFVACSIGLISNVMYGSQLTPALVILAILLATSRGWRACIDGAYRGIQEFRVPALVGMICTSLMAGCIIGLAAVGYRVSMYIAIMAVGTMINCGVLAWVYRKRLANESFLSRKSDPSIWQFFKYSFPLVLRGLSAFLFLKINLLLLGRAGDLGDAGQFGLTEKFLTIPALLLSSALSAVAPRIAAAQLGGTLYLEAFLSKVYGLMLLLTLPMALFFWFNKIILTILFPEYGTASDMLAFFAPVMVVMGLGYAASIIPVQGGKPGLAFLISALSGLANMVAAYLGLKLNGVVGLAIGTAAVHFTTYIVWIVVTHRVFHIRFRIRFN